MISRWSNSDRNRSVMGRPDWLYPSTSPSRRSLRSRSASSNPSSVPATALSRSPALEPSGSRVEQTQAGVLAAADPATQLVQLADAESVGVHHEHHRRIGYVHADLDHGGTHQNIDLTGAERRHHGVLFVGWQPAVHQAEPQSGQRPVTKMLEQLDDGGCRWSGVLAVGLI